MKDHWPKIFARSLLKSYVVMSYPIDKVGAPALGVKRVLFFKEVLDLNLTRLRLLSFWIDTV